ncbi:MAG: PAS domain-containing sensor histidine kinase [Magnetovibrio sp.]|nr:PAS domain-containing sensor histidine kinase [Magnetovibrio sp.]
MVNDYQNRKPRNWPSFSGNADERASNALSRLEDISRLVSEIIWETDKDGILTFVSERSFEVLNLLPQQMIGYKLCDLGIFRAANGTAQAPDWQKPFRDHLFTIKHQNGDIKTLLVSGLPNFDKETWQLAGVYGTAEDITQRLKAEKSFRMLSEIIEQNPSMVFVTDLDGKIEYVNTMFKKMTGYNDHEIIGQTPRLLQSGLTPQSFYEDLWSAVLAGDKWQGEIQNKRNDGSIFWAQLTINPVALHGTKINHFVAVLEDISDRKAAEKRLTLAKEQAEIASRTKSEILANTSHELRTPLNAIIGSSSAIKSETFGPLGNPAYSDYIDIIKESGEHLLALINDILDVASLEASQVKLVRTHFKLAQVLQSSFRLLAPRADHAQITLSYDGIDETLMLDADERRIKQIFLNLLSNAVKFTPDGGQVNVGCSHEKCGGLTISVSDTGIGMDEDDIIKAMSQFGQVESDHTRKYHGTGLGLPLTQGLVELHDGKLEIISIKGSGTSVEIFLPKTCIAHSPNN